MLKQILAGIAGIATAMIIIMGWEILIARAPGYVFIGLLAGYAIGCFGGGAVATLIAGRTYMRPAIVTGVVVMIGGIMNLMDIAHPMWFVITSQFMYVPFAWLGYLLVKQR